MNSKIFLDPILGDDQPTLLLQTPNLWTCLVFSASDHVHYSIIFKQNLVYISDLAKCAIISRVVEPRTLGKHESAGNATNQFQQGYLQALRLAGPWPEIDLLFIC